MKRDVIKQPLARKLQVSLKGEFDLATAGKKMRDLMHQRWLLIWR